MAAYPYRIFIFCSIWLILPPFPGSAQSDFRAIDRHARRTPAALTEDLPALTAYLVSEAAGETEKARALYTWITYHIQYDEEAYRDGRGRINRNLGDILRRQRGVCFDYSLLFAAMCREAGLESEVISGYSKGTITAAANPEEPDHAWNALRVDGAWRLLDATWGSGVVQKDNNFLRTASDQYFLTPPEEFVLNHLPALPMWQLLDCPVPAAVFREPADSIRNFLQQASPCFDFPDSIRQWRELPVAERSLREAEATYRFLPSPGNRHLLGHALMDYAGRLSERAEALQYGSQTDSLILVQQQIIEACEHARLHADTLYSWQRELHLNILINQAVALNQSLEESAPGRDVPAVYRQMTGLLERALRIADELPPESTYASRARAQAEEYLRIVKEWGAEAEKKPKN